MVTFSIQKHITARKPLSKERGFFSFKFTLLLIHFILLLKAPSQAQDPVFSQYYSSGLYLNPALAGAEPDMYFSGIYRSQWSGITPLVTGNFNMIAPFHNQNINHSHWSGVGLSFFYDQGGFNGMMNKLGANASFAYNLYLGESGYNSITFGLQAGAIQKRISTSDLLWGSGYTTGNNSFDPSVDHTTQDINLTMILPDISSGIIYYYNPYRDYSVTKISAFVGLSAYHLNRPNESFLKGEIATLPTLYKLHSGIEFHLGKIIISPNVIAAYQNNVYQINGGTYFTFRLLGGEQGLFAQGSLILGSWYRYNDGLIFLSGISSKHFTLGISYDLNNQSLRRYTHNAGAYEISLSLRFAKPGKIRTYKSPRI